ncbi:MAG: cyclodeaminase/cyclohydrolase family protein [Clostridiales bacterium]|nr:cyclodeaminase/cyclohydrolase family protein [Clostridiales bacterium]
MLTDMTVRDFCAMLASGAPAPGGGSASALSGLLAASLGLMVINLSVGKKAYQALADDEKQALADARISLERDYARLTELTDEDSAAFTAFMDARAIAKDDPGRENAIEAASLRMTETPLETCGICAKLRESLKTVSELGNKNAASDAGTAVLLAQAAMRGAEMNVRINLPSIKNEDKRTAIELALNDYIIRGLGSIE